MKNIKQITWLLLFAIVGLAGACKKDPVMYNKGFTSFKFLVKDALGVEKQYVGTISDAEIVVELPIEVDVTNLKASFSLDNARTIVQVGKVVQENGVSANDFTQPITYTVKAEDKSTRNYSVRITKKSAIKSFGFYTEDNPSLAQNYMGVIKGMTIEVGLPETVNLTTLVARFETTTGATLKVGAVVQESKKTVNDFTAPVIYQFSDANFPTPINFTVSTYFLGRQWELFADKLTGQVTATGIKMAINPFTNNPFFVYTRSGKDESGATIANENKKVAVMGYNGTAWANLGNATGISEQRADVAGIAFNSEGTLYVGYKDYMNSENKSTVLKYNGTAWSVVGASRFSAVKTDYFSLAIAKDDMPIVSMAKNGTDNSGIPARGLYVAGFNGSTWNSITPPGGIVVFYDQIIRGLDGKIYVGIMDRGTGVNKPSLYKYENNVWSAVGPTSFTAPDLLVGFQVVSVAVDKNGEAYLAYQAAPSAGRINHIMKYNKTANVWQELGNPVSSGSEKDKFALAVDADGTLYFAYANASSVMVKTFNKNTNNWNTDRKVISEKVNEFDMQIAGDGTVYIVASIASDNGTVVYKYAK
ncbi:hypothetical protein VRU48_11315 [Pedobacter sp. KR3-3]|uniref:DUF5018 domain-containing protein n=1 Tax=Pedobacter albus TaxID=3113905 RepID=A0ABU7I8K2_9SPHI|nr:hypothetical protein [Pedobacter sp. KR3-3]MEE1945697.1 hypothetical protein [Pedobacter sp. KR3-3]